MRTIFKLALTLLSFYPSAILAPSDGLIQSLSAADPLARGRAAVAALRLYSTAAGAERTRIAVALRGAFYPSNVDSRNREAEGVANHALLTALELYAPTDPATLILLRETIRDTNHISAVNDHAIEILDRTSLNHPDAVADWGRDHPECVWDAIEHLVRAETATAVRLERMMTERLQADDGAPLRGLDAVMRHFGSRRTPLGEVAKATVIRLLTAAVASLERDVAAGVTNGYLLQRFSFCVSISREAIDLGVNPLQLQAILGRLTHLEHQGLELGLEGNRSLSARLSNAFDRCYRIVHQLGEPKP